MCKCNTYCQGICYLAEINKTALCDKYYYNNKSQGCVDFMHKAFISPDFHKLVGTPTEREWPGMSKLPDFKVNVQYVDVVVFFSVRDNTYDALTMTCL